MKVKGAAVESVTLEDLLTVTPSPTSTYIIKTDIEGYDCKVGSGNSKFVQGVQQNCSHLVICSFVSFYLGKLQKLGRI